MLGSFFRLFMSQTWSLSKKRSIMKSEDKVMQEREKYLKNWKIPKMPINKIYRLRMFGFSSDPSIETIEQTIPLHSAEATVSLFSRLAVEKHRKRYHDLHMGIVQVAIKPLENLGPGKSILLCLRDARFLDFKDSLLGGVESSICDDPVYFSCFPDYSISLDDPHVLSVLTLNIRTKGFNTMTNPLPLVLIYRVTYKLGPRAVLTPVNYIGPTPRKGEPLVVLANTVGANVIVSKSVIPRDQFPDHQTYQIVQNADGTVELRFPSLSTSQSINSHGERDDMPHENTTARIYKITDA